MPDNHLRLYRPGLSSQTSRCDITFEHGDITAPGDKADLLVLSAFADDYCQTRRSVIGALGRKGLSVESDVNRDDRVGSPRCWISGNLAKLASLGIAERILCYESESGGVSLGGLQTLFSALFTRAPHPGQAPWSLRIPLIGAGSMMGDPALTLRRIVAGFQESFATGLNVRAVRIIENDPGKFRRLEGVFQELRDGYNPFTDEVAPPLKYKVFISYAHADKDVVRPAYESIKSHINTDVFVDYDGGVNEGTLLSRDLARAVRQSCAMIAVISDAYVASPYCRIEYATAYTRRYLREDFVLKPIFLGDPRSFPSEYRDVIGDTWDDVKLLAPRILEFVSGLPCVPRAAGKPL